jgi:hypothetical protein
MDDTAQKQNQVNDDAQVQPQPQSQVAPVGTANKEIGVAPVSEFIKPSEKIIIDKEVTEAGIVEAEREIKIEEEHERMGIKPSAESTPVKTEPTGLVQLPMDEKEAEKQIKKGPGHNINLEKFFEGIFFADSVYGFAVLMAKHLKRIHHKITGQPI